MLKTGETIVGLFALLLCCAGLCTAQADVETKAAGPEDHAARVEEMIPGFQPKLGTYSYSIHWLFKTGANTEISIERFRDRYYMRTTAQTGRFIDVFYKMRFQGEAVLLIPSLVPESVDVSETIRTTSKHTVMAFDNGIIKTIRTSWKKNEPPFSVKQQEINAKDSAAMDYFSAIIVARGLPWQKGDSRKIVVFDGRGLNNVTLHCLGREPLKVKDDTIEVWHLTIKIAQIGEVREDDKLIAENIHLYLTADDLREIVFAQADTPYGDIRIKLENFQPVPDEKTYFESPESVDDGGDDKGGQGGRPQVSANCT